MLVVEKTIIKKSHQFYKELDRLAFLSKNLYNYTLYIYRQAFFKKEKLPKSFNLIKQFAKEKQSDYISLPRKVSQWVVIQVEEEFKSFWTTLKAWIQAPQKFNRKPNISNYKDKLKGRNLLTYSKQAINIRHLAKQQIVGLSGSKIIIPVRNINRNNIKEIKVSHKANCYIIYIIYEIPDIELKLLTKYAAQDLGINNLGTITFSDGSQPLIINGKPLKSINQYYNKTQAKLQSQLQQENKTRRTSNRINQLSFKRNNKINDYLHKASTFLVNQLVFRNVSHFILGYNPGWKQETNIGKINNQNFVSIPFLQYIQMIEYKCAKIGITTIRNEESYTSKCSFLDLELIEKHEEYMGKRVKRGLFKSASGREINADINGSYNIMRKVVPEVFDKGIEGVAVHPVVVTL